MEKSLDRVVAAARERGQFGGLQDVLDWLREKLLEDGICANKDALIAKLDWAVDQIVAIDIPYIPNLVLEPMLDEILAKLAKAKVRALIAKMCP